MKIRPLTIEDMAAVRRIYQMSFDEYELALHDIYCALLKPSAGHYTYAETFVAETIRVVGVCGCYRLAENPTHCCGVNWLAVYPLSREQGIGTALVRHAESIAAKRSEVMFVYSDKKSVDFYRALGYEKRPNSFPEYEGTTLLFKDLET